MPEITRTPNKKISINLKGTIGIPNNDATVLLIGHRIGVLSGAVPDYNLLKPKFGYPNMTAYKSYDLPSFSNTSMAMEYMRALGFTVNYGLSNNLVFSAPTSVTAPTTKNEQISAKLKTKKQLIAKDGTTSVILEWDVAPIGFELLIGSGKTITITQGSSVGKVKAINVEPYQLSLTEVTGTFTTTEQVKINYIDNNTNVPDPSRTDEICMMVYYAINSINSKFPTGINTVTPKVSICYLNPDDTGFGPSSLAIQYLKSDGTDATITTIESLPNGNTAIYFDTTPANFGITPLSELGTTLVAKDDSNLGTLVQVLPGITGSGIGIELKDMTGTLAANDTVKLTFDSTKDVFNLLTSYPKYPVSPYEIKLQSDINEPTSKFKPLWDYLKKANDASSVTQGAFFAMGVVANISTTKEQVNTLPSFDTDIIGAQYITGSWYPYVAKLGDYPLSAAMQASSYAGIIACNDVPFNPVNNTILSLPVVADLTTVLNDPSYIESALDLGWSPIAVNAKKQAYIVRAVTGLLNLPGSEVPDDEYFPVTDWQILGLWKQAVFDTISQPEFTNKRKSPQLKDDVIQALRPLALNFEERGMFFNMVHLIGQFRAVDDPDDPDKYDLVTPVCVTPEFNAIEVTVNVVSYLSQVTTSA